MNKLLVFSLAVLVAPVVSLAQEDWSSDRFMAETGVREGPVAVRELPGWRANPVILVRDRRGEARALAAAFPDVSIVAVQGIADAMQHVRDADVIVGFCDADLIEAAVRLVWVQTSWAGVEDCLTIEKLARGEVLLTNMQKMSSPTIGEHAIAMLLSLTRGLPRFAREMPHGNWRRDLAASTSMQTLHGKTMLVAGLGGIGSQVAMRGKALGMRVLATRNSSREAPSYVDYVGLADELPRLVADADVVVNALPLTPSTEGLFNRALFAGMKHGAYFINVGRGRTVVTDDLLDALESGQLLGAGLDVTDPEPLPPDHRLWQLPGVIITPHVSGTGNDRRLHNRLLRENIGRYLAGQPLLNVVDPERGY